MSLEEDQQRDQQFAQLLTQNHLRIRGYVFTLVRDSADAEDVVQEACTALWTKRHAYDSSRNFTSWALGIALVEVLRYRRRVASDKLQFDEALINLLAVDFLERVEYYDDRRAALPHCLNKLSPQDRRLVEARYTRNTSVGQIAEELGRPLSTVYSSLARIREALHRCVEVTLARESHVK